MWEHLFLTGEFVGRERLLSGLTLAQVTSKPDGLPHSIYDELWHLTTWQRIVVERDEAGGEEWAQDGPLFPEEPPASEAQWHSVVGEFLEGATSALELAGSPERLAVEVEPGVTMAHALHSVAVHNAYHFGKIVALRQAIGAWPPARHSRPD
ncbi:MAG TPA: DinB family protein [Trueperaceae bacterium]